MAELKNIKKIGVDTLKPYENNAKIHSDAQIEKLSRSIEEFGFISPVLIDKDFNVIAGHGRIEAAKRLQMDKIPCAFIEGLTEAQRRAYIIADNRLAEFGEWNEEMIQIEMADLMEMDLGFDIDDFDFPKVVAPDLDDLGPEIDTRDPSCQHNVFENQDRMQFTCDNFFGMPQMTATQTTGDKLLRFADWKEVDDLGEYIAHFYYDDYKFINAWRQPDKYLDRLKQFKAVISPDFSLYTDFPRALQILSCYRRQWCGAFWQENGIDVIPDVVWGDKDSYSYCFEGIPSGGTVAVSTVGVKNDKEWNGKEGEIFRDGYDEMLRRLEPTTILFYGDMIDGLEGNIIRCPSFYEQKRQMLNEKAKEKKDGQRE